MSRATTSRPVSDRRVLTGCLLNSARISGIGRFEVDGDDGALAGRARADRLAGVGAEDSWVASGREPRRIGLQLLDEDALGGDLASTAWRSAEHETAIATGSDAPWRGRRMTRTSWQK